MTATTSRCAGAQRKSPSTPPSGAALQDFRVVISSLAMSVKKPLRKLVARAACAARAPPSARARRASAASRQASGARRRGLWVMRAIAAVEALLDARNAHLLRRDGVRRADIAPNSRSHRGWGSPHPVQAAPINSALWQQSLPAGPRASTNRDWRSYARRGRNARHRWDSGSSRECARGDARASCHCGARRPSSPR